MVTTISAAVHRPVSESTPEVAAAARWWRWALVTTTPPGDIGGLLGRSRLVSVPPSTDVIDAFEVGVRRRLVAKFNDRGCWLPDDPVWCSVYRIVACNFAPCPLLAEAYAEAGGDDEFAFLFEAIMHVDPGVVTVRRDGAEDVVWRAML